MALRYILPLLALIAAAQAFNVPAQNSRAHAISFKEEVLQRHLALKQSLIPNKFRTSNAPLVSSCNETISCLDGSFQICHRDTCQCENPSEARYWYSDQQCKIDAGRPCLPDEGSTPCIKNSACRPDPNSRTGHSCKCQAGMESDGFYCVRGYGEKCKGYYGSDDGCNYIAGHDCIEGRCQCYVEPDQIYDPLQKRCVGREGFQCIVLDIGYLGCVTGTKCYRRDDLTEYPLFGVCRKDPATSNEVLYTV